MNGGTLARQLLIASWAPVKEKAAMNGTGSYQTEIPDRPPDRLFAEASGTHAGFP